MRSRALVRHCPALVALLAVSACAVAPGDGVEERGAAAAPITASGSGNPGWNVAWDKPAPQLAVGNFAVVQDAWLPTHVFWTDSKWNTFFSAQSENGWTPPLPLYGASWGIAAARSYGYPGEYLVAVSSNQTRQLPTGAPEWDGGVWVQYNGNDLGADPTKGWSGWIGLGGAMANPQPAIAVQANVAHVFVVGTNSQVFHTWGLGTAWGHGWAQLPALPGGHQVSPGLNAIHAATRGGNNVLGDPYVDLVVVATDQTVWHMKYAAQTGAGSWEPVPSTVFGSSALGAFVTSTDTNTVDVLELTASGPGVFASSSPGTWVMLPAPAGVDPANAPLNCRGPAFGFTSSGPGQLDFYEVTMSGALYHDGYGPNPSTAPGPSYCQ